MEAPGSPLKTGAAKSVKKNATKLGEKPLRFSPLFIQKWPGNNKFVFNGRYITGGNLCGMGISSSLIFFPSLAFLIITSRLQVNAVLCALPCIVLVMSSLFFLFRVGCTDPGIIPRSPPDTEEGQPVEEYVNGIKITRKFCKTCRIYRNLRSKHCAECNNCVKRFDHHCPWVSNCVGQRNYYYFILFIMSTFALCAYVTVMCVFYAYQFSTERRSGPRLDRLGSIVHGMGMNPFTLGVFTLASLMGLAIGNMLLFHFSLICMNKTTHEVLKNPYGSENPFTMGWVRNCRAFCLIPADTSELYKIDAMLRLEHEDESMENVNEPMLFGRPSSTKIEMDDLTSQRQLNPHVV